MGTYLSTPITEKCDESGESLECITSTTDEDNNNDNNSADVPVEWGVVDMQGWRKSMEDSHTAVTTVPIFNNNNTNKEQQKARVFGVYDGHGGAEVARFCQYYFVDVLMNQPSWMEVNNNNENENNMSMSMMPLTGDDERVPLPPPVPTDIYNGDGNEMGYRSKHLLNASETPVGKSLREAFHAMDRLIDDPTRQHEISILRSTKTVKGATKLLEDGFSSIPIIIPTLLNIAPDFYTKNKQNQETNQSSMQAETTVVAALADVVDDADILPVNTNIDDHAALPSAVPDDNITNEDGRKEQAQADKSLSTVLTPEQAEVLKQEIEEFEKKTNADNNDEDKVKEDDDSDAVVGIEEAIVLDSNIDNDIDNDEDEDDCDDGIITAEDAKTPPSTSTSTSTTTTMLQKILSLGGAAVQAAAGTALPAEDENENEKETSAIVTSSNDDVDDDDDNNGSSLNTTTPGGTGTPSVTYPRSVDVSQQNVRYPSVIHNGRLVCNLPDHPIHAGATAVVAVITGKILTVANAGDSRAVLCRRRRNRTDGNNGTDDGNTNGNNADDGHYAFPLSYDHKPSQTHELNRILCSGGFVNHFGRINGNLNLSRSIGDLKYKQVPGIPPEDQMITAEPDIMQIVVEDEDEFIILGCDGIWDCLSNEQAVNFVMERIQTKTPVEIGTEMLDTIISDDPRITQGIGGDNMTIMIIDLQTSKRVRRKKSNTSTDDSLPSTKENEDVDNNMTTTSEAAME